MKNGTLFQIFKPVLVIITVILSLNLTGGGETKTSLEPSFVELQEDQGSFTGKIYDDKNVIEIKDLSFTGHTSIGGIRKEDDDSINRLEFSEIKELTIIDSNYISKKYQDKEFILANAISNSGEKIERILIPRQVVVCGIQKKTNVKKAWFLRKIKKIIIDKTEEEIQIAQAQAKSEEEPGMLSKIAGGIKSVVKKLNPEE